MHSAALAEISLGTKPVLRLIPLDGNTVDIAADVSKMHMALLPRSPAALLGGAFLRDCYYTLLPARGLIRAAAAYVDGMPAGFVAVTRDPNGFMRAALKRSAGRIGWIVALSFLERPIVRATALAEAISIMQSRTQSAGQPGTGELLSIGVLPEFRGAEFSQRTGLRIARRLLARGVRLLIRDGATRVTAVVDADNYAAQRMYRRAGWFQTQSQVTGWRTPSIEFAKDPISNVRRATPPLEVGF